MTNRSVLRAFATVSGFTGLSRILGFVRDQLLGAIIGPGVVLDAWNAAFRLPNMFRRLFAEGAMSAAFVPMLRLQMDRSGPEGAKAFATAAFSILFLILTPLIILLIILMPWLMDVMTRFEPGSVRFDLAVGFGRIMIPYLLLMSLMALIGGVLDALGRFGPKALAPTALNVILVSLLIITSAFDLAPGSVLSWGTLAAGLAQLAIVWWPAAQLGWTPRLRIPRGVGLFLRRMVPGVIARGGFQISSLIVLFLATTNAGDLSRLNFADRIYQLPIGLIGIALNTVLLSTLSGLIASGKIGAARVQINRALEVSLLLSIPIALACAFHGSFLFQGLFQVGNFTAGDSAAAGLALSGYAIGIPAAVGQSVMQPAFNARQDTRSPMFHSLASVVVAVALSLALYPRLGIFGLALSASAASWLAFISLSIHLASLRYFTPDGQLVWRVVPMMGASLAMVIALGGILWLLGGITWLSFALRLPLTLLLIAGSGALYGVLCFTLGATSKADLRNLLGRT